MVLASGDQRGFRSSAVWLVSLSDRALAMSSTRMSAGAPRPKATYLASGESSGPRYSASAPAASPRVPFLSNQTSKVLPPTPPPAAVGLVRYASAPVMETEKGNVSAADGANGSAITNAAPVN